ncbi:MAG: M1 family metallopeptidase [Ignavibacteriaceae bacterium]
MKIKSYTYYAIIFILPLTVTALIFTNNISEVQSGLKKEFYLHHLNKYYKIFNTEDYVTDNQRKIDILHYDLFFDLFPDEKEFDASVVIKGVVKEEGLKSIELNFYDNFEIGEVKLNGIKREYINEDKLLAINSGDSVPLDTFELEVTYSGTPKKAGIEGFVFGKINGTSLVYNLSEPSYASSWYPCNDFPSDKALLDIRIKNDSSQVSISNGLLIGTEDDGERRTYHWKTNYPISTYLIAIYSSSYQHFSDKYISIDMQDTMAIDYYVLLNNVEDAETDFQEHPEMLRFFAETFGEYPFIKEKYGVAEFLWQLGAMEHQTITGVASNIIGGKNFFLDIYIHELAHHWWGNAVGPKSWNDIWLNEGFSTYSEALYYEFKSGKSALRSSMLSKSQGSFSTELGNPGSFLFSETVYNKGAWVLHMLRWELGDKTFFKVLREYYEKFKYSNASTEDFKAVCESISEVNFTKFFDQWLNGTGKIELIYKWNSKRIANEFETIITLEQVQDGYDSYCFLLGMNFKYANDELESFRYNIDSRTAELTVRSKNKPVEIILDPNDWLLMTESELVEN